MIERINDFVARYGRGVGTSAGSFVRIGVWTVAFLALISMVLPSRQMTVAQVNGPRGKALARTAVANLNPQFETFGLRRLRPNDPVQNLRLSLDDQRAFAKSPFGKKRFRIAWIAGSEGEVFDRGRSEYLPSSVIAHIPEIGGRRPAVDLYFLLAIRTADTYFALLDALETKPDMIVISLNPVWTLNPLAVHQWMQLDSNAARQLVDEPASWPIAAALLSPSDLMWGIGSSALRPIRDRWYYSQRVHRAFDDFGPLDRSDLAKAPLANTPDWSKTLLISQPSTFFLSNRVPASSGNRVNDWARSMQVDNAGENTLNRTLLRAIARELRSSNIPSYVYLAQVNTAYLANRPFARALGGVEHQLAELRPDFAAANVVYEPEAVSRKARPGAFRPNDPIHLARAGQLAPYLARQLCRLAAQVGERATCR